jgi:hypothetical protein
LELSREIPFFCFLEDPARARNAPLVFDAVLLKLSRSTIVLCYVIQTHANEDARVSFLMNPKKDRKILAYPALDFYLNRTEYVEL